MDPTSLDVIDAGAMATLAALTAPILDLLTLLAVISILMLGLKAAIGEDVAVFRSVFDLLVSVAIIQGIVRGMPLIWDALRQFGEAIAGQAIGETLVTPTAVIDILFATIALIMEQLSGIGAWQAVTTSFPVIGLSFIVMIIIIAAYALVFYILASAYIRLGWSAVATVAMAWMSVIPQLRFATKNGLASMISASTQILLVSLMTSVLYNAVQKSAAVRGELTLAIVFSWGLAAGFTLLGALVGKEIADAISRGGPEMGSGLITQAGSKIIATAPHAGRAAQIASAVAGRASGSRSTSPEKAALSARRTDP